MNASISRLLRALSEPLLIEPRTGGALVELFGRKLAGEQFSGEEIHQELQIATRTKEAKAPPRIAIVPIHGVIAQRPQSLGTSTDEIGAMFSAAMVSPQVDGVLLHIDSPGGTVGGVPELAEEILRARGTKPMIAIADGLMASAAYWIGSAADEVIASPSSELGSIGVWTAHEDWSKWFENEGIKINALSAGKHKLEGNPWEPLSAEARTFLQSRVDEVYGWFVKAVAQQRRDTQQNVRAGYGEGRVLGAKQAVNVNLADRVGTVQEAVDRLVSRIQLANRGQRADLLRSDLALEH